MPCYTEPHSYCNHKNGECSERGTEDVIKYYKDKADEVTNMLCRVMGEIEYQEPGIVLDQDVKDWWARHKKFDKERNKP